MDHAPAIVVDGSEARRFSRAEGASGIYFMNLNAGDRRVAAKLVIMR